MRWNVTHRIRRWKQRRLLIADAMIFESDKDARTPHRRGVHPRRSGREEAVRSRRCVLPYPEKPFQKDNTKTTVNKLKQNPKKMTQYLRGR